MQLGDLQKDELALVAGGLAIVAFVVWGVRSYLRGRPDPEELERRRRLTVNAIGKMGDGIILELQGNNAIFSYDVRGVEYTAGQDLTALTAQLPPEPWVIIGPVSVKYDPRNPANSIILCEFWNGLRITPGSGQPVPQRPS